MQKTLAVVVLLLAVGASAGTITSLDPSTITAGSGEYFMTIYGSDLGDQLLFDGPQGRFVLEINARDTGYVVGWVPMEIALNAGTYTVTVLGGNSGDSGPATFRVVGPNKFNKLALYLPEDLAVIAIGKGATVRWTVFASGGEDPNPTVTCDPRSGSFFGLGATTVNCIATNQFGESDKGSFSVFVHDVTPPVLRLPGKITAPADAREGAFVKFEVSATDDNDGVVPVVCDHKSGELFPVGVTQVGCAATDSALNYGAGSFLVDVVDKESRFELHVPDPMFAEAQSREGAIVDYTVYVTGTLDPNPSISCDPKSGSLFPMKTTTVYCRASDSFGHSAEGKFDVTVADTTAPIIDSLIAVPDTFDAKGDYVLSKVEVRASDLVDPMPRCSIVYVLASETISERDWSLPSELEAKLLAVTNGLDNRVYSLGVSCSDESGNASLDEATVTIVSRGGGSAAQSAPASAKRRTVRP